MMTHAMSLLHQQTQCWHSYAVNRSVSNTIDLLVNIQEYAFYFKAEVDQSKAMPRDDEKEELENRTMGNNGK